MSNLYIREFNEFDIQFYKACMSNKNWRKLYGEVEEPENLDEFLEQRTQDYPYVKRYIFLSCTNHAKVAFGIANFGEGICEECTMSGGVSPELIGKGYGLKSSIIFCHYIFTNFSSIKRIFAYHQNKFSERMLLKIGFSNLSTSRKPDEQPNKLSLSRNDFPNSFCKKILNLES
jgi:hypothetical protein